MQRKALASAVWDLFAVLQVQVLDVVAELRKGCQGIVAYGLAAAKAEFAEEAPATTGYVFHDDPLDVDLELE